MQLRSKRSLRYLVLLVLIVGAGAVLFVRQEKSTEEQKLELAEVKRGTIEDVIVAQGKLEPKDYVDVGVQVSGQLKKLYVDIGNVVKKSDLLAELDPQSYQSRVDGDKAKLKSLEAQLDQQKAQADYDRLENERARKLIKSGAISQSDAEAKGKALKVSEATVVSLQAQIEQAQADLDTDTISLGYTKIYAPMDGVVSDLVAREGQTLNANQTTPKILQIANLNVMTIRAQVAEADVPRLSPGMEATFNTLGSFDRKWTGKIRQILPTPEVINDVVLYDALIDVENTDGQLMNGMSTQDNFVVAKVENVLTIPIRALGRRLMAQESGAGRVYQVRVMEAGRDKPVVREVTIGLMTRSQAEVKAGLNEDEQVVTSGAPSGERTPGMANTPKRVPGGARL